MMDDGYRDMRIGKLRHLAESGDARAQQALADSGREIGSMIRSLPDPAQVIREQTLQVIRRQEAMLADFQREAEEIAEHRARREREAVAREEAMLREIAAMHETVERSEARGAAAEDRAQAAEEREAERRETAERREWAMAAMAAVSVVAAVIAIFT